ncbi:hypothetical protein BC628DRAFT_888217 [Trametes gibbosa]|nr:hypothetical protein BC628DRAFT_888217 [Trametes gibbosa]
MDMPPLAGDRPNSASLILSHDSSASVSSRSVNMFVESAPDVIKKESLPTTSRQAYLTFCRPPGPVPRVHFDTFMTLRRDQQRPIMYPHILISLRPRFYFPSKSCRPAVISSARKTRQRPAHAHLPRRADLGNTRWCSLMCISAPAAGKLARRSICSLRDGRISRELPHLVEQIFHILSF